MTSAAQLEQDRTAGAIIDFLRHEGAARLRHAGGRTLLDHLAGTYDVVRRWEQPLWLRHAALIHSVYGTDSYDHRLLDRSRRNELAAVAGSRAERLAHQFSVTPRRPLFAGTHRWVRDLPTRSQGGKVAAMPEDRSTRADLDALVLLHMANIAEQNRAPDGSPGRWLVRVRDLAEMLLDSESVAPPLFIALMAASSEQDESLAREAYTDALRDEGEGRERGLALAAAGCPAVPEPCVWLALMSRNRGEGARSRSWTAQARKRLSALGTSWDKRLTYEQWLAIIEALEGAHGIDIARIGATVGDPRPLFAVVDARERGGGSDCVGGPEDGGGGGEPDRRADRLIPRSAPAVARAPSTATSAPAGQPAIVPPAGDGGRRRFQRYIESLAEGGGSGSGAIYPDLPSRPWHDPREFPIVGYLESNFPAIRSEVLALAGARFHRESERIRRTGDWDVAFLYERGRRRDEVCASCPVTAHGIETHATIRTHAGLAYVSRMRPATHISAHRGPTNLRLRCHLAIKVPHGDCAIRVGDDTRQWQEGRCLVFDDLFVHEAWNHADSDRIVLVVDLWHPGLSATEVMLLEALHNYTYRHARKLSRYWAANAAAAREAMSEKQLEG